MNRTVMILCQLLVGFVALMVYVETTIDWGGG